MRDVRHRLREQRNVPGDVFRGQQLRMGHQGADAHDIGLTVHPHPTLSETVAMAAEAYAGTLTDLYLPKKRAAH